MNVSSTTRTRQLSASIVVNRVSSAILGSVMLTMALTACIGPIKPVPTQQSQEAPPPPTETADAPKTVAPAPSDAPPSVANAPAMPLPPIGMGQPTAPQGEEEMPGKEEIPVVEAKPVIVAAARESYKVQNAFAATRMDTPIMQTPVAIQVVPQQVLRDQQVIRLDQAFQNVSGVYAANNGGQGESDNFIIRGFGAEEFVDGVRNFQAFGAGGTREMANIEKVEVLKGAASILYGRTEPGGLVNVVTKKPLATPYYSIQQQIGSFNFYRTTTDATGPLNESKTLLYRFNMAYEKADSFRELVNNERLFFAPTVQWNVSDRTQALFQFEYKRYRDPLASGLSFPAIGDRPANLPRERNLGESFVKIQGEQYRVVESVKHDLNSQWTLRHRFSADIVYANDHNLIPLGFSTVPLLDRLLAKEDGISSQAYFGNLELTGKFDTGVLGHTLGHTVLLGGDYQNLRLHDNFSTSSTLFPIDIFNPVHGLVDQNAVDPATLTKLTYTESWYGLYLQDFVKLPYGFFLLAGARYDNAKLDIATDPGGGTPTHNGRARPRVALLWQPRSELSLYASYSESFGAPNTGFLTAVPVNKPQVATQKEVGVKTELFDGRLRGSVALFEITKTNLVVFDPTSPSLSNPIGEARSRGVELDLAGEILPGWSVIGNYAYTDVTTTKDQGDDGAGGVTTGVQGKRFPGIPLHGGSLWTTYRFDERTMWQGLTVGAGMVARSSHSGDADNTFKVPGYTIANLMTSYQWNWGGTAMTAQLNVQNLFDTDYFQTGTPGNTFIWPGAPRTFLGMIKMELW
jgi:iron complex outermembrane receptor protein